MNGRSSNDPLAGRSSRPGTWRSSGSNGSEIGLDRENTNESWTLVRTRSTIEGIKHQFR